MADGSEVASKVAQIVLMDSDFTHLPEVVKEGRRCINNVRGSAVLFLMKTILTLCVSLFAIFTLDAYPFSPNNFLFLELFVIGIASVLLALEPNDKRIQGSFLESVIAKSAPCALAMFAPTLVILVVGRISSVVTLVGFINLLYICRPYTRWRAGVVALVGVLLSGAIAGVALAEAFLLDSAIFGFSHVAESPAFFSWMFALGATLSIVLNFFRSHLEAWFAGASKKTTDVLNKFSEEGGKNGD